MARQKWWAISVGTILLLTSYWLVVFAFVASESENAPPAAPALALGLALVPLVYVALAGISRQPALGGATVAAMLLFLVIGVPVAAVARDPVSGLVAGFGAGGVAALRREVHQSWQARSLAVAIAATFVLIAVRVVPILALLLAPIITLPSIGLADIYTERTLEKAQSDGEPTSGAA